MDEFVAPATTADRQSIRGILAPYAKPTLAEKGAWEHAMVDKYGNV